MQKSIKSILLKAKDELRSYSSSPEVDAEVLVCFIKNISKLDLITKSENIFFDLHELERLRTLIERRKLKEPVAYLISKKEFFGRDFYVDSRVLIPRPETEIIVEEVLKRNASQNVALLDLGTGSGCIAISLSCEFEKQRIPFCACGVDISEGALEVAAHNAEKHYVKNINFKKSSWFEQVQGTFDFIVSNPPYISEYDNRVHSDTHLYEPHVALYAGQRGDEAIKEILKAVPTFLSPHGMFMFEFGAGQGEGIKNLCLQVFNKVEIKKDLQGIERACICYDLR